MIVIAITYFLLIKDTAIKSNTAAGYRSTQRIFSAWLESKGLGELALGDFTVTIAYSFFDYLKTERKCANKTYNNYLINLNSIFNFYVNREIIAKNPLANLSLLNTESGKHVPFTNAQTKLIKERIQKKEIPNCSCLSASSTTLLPVPGKKYGYCRYGTYGRELFSFLLPVPRIIKEEKRAKASIRTILSCR